MFVAQESAGWMLFVISESGWNADGNAMGEFHACRILFSAGFTAKLGVRFGRAVAHENSPEKAIASGFVKFE